MDEEKLALIQGYWKLSAADRRKAWREYSAQDKATISAFNVVGSGIMIIMQMLYTVHMAQVVLRQIQEGDNGKHAETDTGTRT